ncbi:UNVERIFIED_ORG: uncharacterized protein YfbU (UPF0304 family) [Xanthobacter viscosus]|nr:YfbU family protein [Xanthobacter autotrophicus]
MDAEALALIDNWRSQQDDLPSRAEAIRRLVEAGLRRQGEDREMRPSQTERLMLWMLAEVLKQNPEYDNIETANLIQKSVYGGHFWALKWELVGILHDRTVSNADVSFVADVLDMWSFIEEAGETLGKADRSKLVNATGPWNDKPKFSGFDGNNEGLYLSIATFMVKEMNRFERFKDRSLNSHSPSINRNRAMLAIFEPMRGSLVGRSLNVDELIAILQ